MQKRIGYNVVLPGLPGSSHSINGAALPCRTLPETPRQILGRNDRARPVRHPAGSIVMHYTKQGPVPVISINGEDVNLTELVAEKINSLSPEDRWQGMVQALINAVIRLRGQPWPIEEREALQLLCETLVAASDGDYTNPVWPKRKSGFTHETTFVRQKAMADLMALAKFGEHLDKCFLIESCSRAAHCVDQCLQQMYGTTLGDLMHTKRLDQNGDPRSDRRKKNSRPAKLHPRARVIHDWITQKSADRPYYHSMLARLDEALSDGRNPRDLYNFHAYRTAVSWARSAKGSE